MQPTQRGFTISELLTTIAIIGMVASISTPALLSYLRRSAVRSAASEIRSVFHLARSRAIARNSSAGLKFSTDGVEWRYALCDDGDGDGLRNDDLAAGIDRCVDAPRPVLRESRFAKIGLPSITIKDPDGNPFKPSSSPVQFNASTICSFSPIGQSTPGTIYLTDRDDDVYAVRTNGAGARIRVLRYDRTAAKWVAP